MLDAAFVATDQGVTRRQAARIAKLPLSTFQYRLDRRHSPPTKRRTLLTEEEEKNIVSVLKRFSNRGHPLTRDDLADTVELLVRAMPLERRSKLPFVNCRPGKKFVRLFTARHIAQIKLGKARPQEAVRWAATNADVLTTHFVQIEALMKEHNIDAKRLANLDESGCSPERGTGTNRMSTYITRHTLPQQRAPKFKNVKRVTIMPVIFANGDTANPLFVVEGCSLMYRIIDVSNRDVCESLADCIPRGAYITTREEVAGIDKKIFREWATRFVKEVADLTQNGRKVLLLYDGYRSHMGIEVLETLEKGGVIAYALPSHTSGSTQPLDVGLFGPFKHHLNKEICATSTTVTASELDKFDFLKLMREAYEASFTRANIISAFEKAGLWPVDPHRLLRTPRPYSSEDASRILSVKEMEEMLELKRKTRAQGIGLRPKVSKCGYLDTSKGLNLCSQEAMKLVKEQEERKRSTHARKLLYAADKSAREALAVERVRRERVKFEQRKLWFRVKRYGDPNVMPRTLKVRRSLAVRRKLECKVATESCSSLHQ